MRIERKFTWCVRIYDVMSGSVEYRVYTDWTTSEIKHFIGNYAKSRKDCIVRLFKNYKKF